MCRSFKCAASFILLLVVMLTACGPTATPAPPIAAPTAPPAPTATAEPTATEPPPPTDTPLPTARPQPTATPPPTEEFPATPRPNAAFGLPPTFEADVTIGQDTSLYLVCFGVGTPTVVLDAGYGDAPQVYWRQVLPEVAAHTRVCAYSRDPSYNPYRYIPDMGGAEGRSAATFAEQLHTLLIKAHIAGPYILAGHGIAALLDVVFAGTYPQDTAGLVLVEGAHPDECERLRDALPPESPDDSPALKGYRADLLHCGLYLKTNTQAPDLWASNSYDQARAVTSLGDLPLAVLVGRDWARDLILPAAVSPLRGQGPQVVLLGPDGGEIPPAVIDSQEQVWVELQAGYAALSTRGSLVVLEDMGYFIPKDQPQAVIDAILRVLEMAR